MKRLLAPALLLVLALTLCTGSARARENRPAELARPRLVVLISIDQFRADYLTRFKDLYLQPTSGRRVGGFRWLMDRGAWYPDCRYQHYRTITGVGHAILSSGAQPMLTGIVGNSWFDRATGKSVYCVDDPDSRLVSDSAESKAKPMSPANLRVTTIGDELELATGGEARTVSVSLKDRASILLGGHRVDEAIWYDDATGRFISSSFYFPSGKLPDWVTALNNQGLPEKLRQTPWTPSVTADALRRVWNPQGGPVSFSHPRSTGYNAFTVSPAGNELTLDAARAAVEAEHLGSDDIPDLLTINLASNDYVGHRYGPDSAEVLDISVATDRLLSGFFNDLARMVPGGLGNVTVAISADHGVVSNVEQAAASKVPAGHLQGALVTRAADEALDAAVGAEDWIVSAENGELYFRDSAIRTHADVPRARLEEFAADAIGKVPGVYMAVGRTAILTGQIPPTPMARRIVRSFYPARSGDVVVVLDPQWLPGGPTPGGATSHGTPYTYDTSVPLLMGGFGVRPGTYLNPAAPAQLAPSLAYVVRVARPSGAEEPLLPGLAVPR